MIFDTGVIAATFVCPLDVIKTRFQVHGTPQLANGSVKGMCFLVCLSIIILFLVFTMLRKKDNVDVPVSKKKLLLCLKYKIVP
jgi:hypothetical protein